jgi:protein-disulfide isomerase
MTCHDTIVDMDRKECMKKGQHTTAGGKKEKDAVEIGPEIVIYEDTICPHCGTPADRQIVNRMPK